MHITAVCTLNQKAVTALNRSSMNRKRLVLLCGVYLILFAFARINFLYHPEDDIFNWVIFAIVLFGAFLCCMLYIIMPRIQYKALSKQPCLTQQYTFTEDTMLVSACGEGVASESRLAYTALHKVVETKAYFFFYQSPASAFVVEKAALQGGTPEDLRALLQPVLQSRYICQK